MAFHFGERSTGPFVTRTSIPVLLTAVLVAGCDSGPAELAREIDAAREGCTEEMLKAGDEQCVRMFETYADMAADAMETYIGGMRAFDEAIQRRGGLQFDTAGLGNALGDGSVWAADPIGAASRSNPAMRRVDPGQQGYGPMPDPYAESAYGYPTGGQWSDPAPEDGMPAPVYPGGAEATARAGAVQPPARSTAGRRGVLLPPEERLRRPWIDDAEGGDRYVGDEPPPDAGRAPNAPTSGWYPYPNAPQGGYPYPYGAPQGAYPYPYGAGSGSPYPYGMQGAYPYPGAGPGVAYPYADPALGEYPYPDGRRGGW